MITGYPYAPGLTVVEYMVKNASWPGLVIFTAPGRELFCASGWLDCNSDGGVMQVLSARGTAQMLRGNKQGNRDANLRHIQAHPKPLTGSGP